MPSLRIPFPENDEPVLVALRGARITIGRTPDNTIQIRDRTVSAHHAEILAEGDGYRLHDLGSTNGMTVDGEAVTDFHLREKCKVTFGSVECEFSPEASEEAAVDAAHALMSRAEGDALVAKNAELEQTIVRLREQLKNVQELHAAKGGATVPQADFDRALAEAAALKEIIAARVREVDGLKADLAVMRRDRDNLQRVLEGKREAAPQTEPAPDGRAAAHATPPAAEIAPKPAAPSPAGPVAAPVTAPAAAPRAPIAAAAAVPAQLPKPPAATPATAPSPLPKPPVPVPAATPSAQPKPSIAVPTATPSPLPKPPVPAPSAAPTQLPKPAIAAPLAKPPIPLKPAAQGPAAPSAATPATPTAPSAAPASPAALGTATPATPATPGVRAVPAAKPPIPLGAKPAAPGTPMKPLPIAKPPIAKPAPGGMGPKGTQKIV